MDLKFVFWVLVGTLPFFLLSVWALVDALQKDFGTIGKKAIWGFVAAVPYIGFIIYFLFGRRKGVKPVQTT
jgi:hypothetical protein